MRRLFAFAVLVTGLVFAFGAPAGAHSTLVSSDPADGSVVDTFPGTVELTFSEPVSPSASTVEFIAADGTVIAAETRGSDAATALLVDVADVPDGLYSMRWTAFSSSDGHVTRGMLIWGAGNVDLADAEFSEPTSSPAITEILGRWLLFGALGLVLGAAAVCFLAARPLRQRYAGERDLDWHVTTGRRLHLLQRRGLAVAAAASAALIVFQVGSAWRSSGLGLFEIVEISLLSSTWGRVVVLRLVALVVALIAVRRTTGTNAPAVVAAIAAVALTSASGHAAGADQWLFAITNDIVHLLSALGWGGLVIALAALLRRDEAERDRQLRQEAIRRSSGAAVALAVTASVTGLLAIGEVVQSVDGLVRSGYGVLLSAKVVLVLVLAAVGLAGRRPQWTGRQILVAGGTATVALILALVSVVTASSPATGGEWLAPSDGTQRQLAVVSNDVQIGMSVTPNVPGQNFLLIDAGSTRRPEPAPIARVIVRVDALDVERSRVSFDATPVEPEGSFEVATTAFSVPGRYDVEVVVRRLGIPDETVTFEWTVASTAAGPAAISHQPLADVTVPLGSLAAIVGAVVLVGYALAEVRRDRRLRDVVIYTATQSERNEASR